jgi:hypothetical protein
MVANDEEVLRTAAVDVNDRPQLAEGQGDEPTASVVTVLGRLGGVEKWGGKNDVVLVKVSARGSS